MIKDTLLRYLYESNHLDVGVYSQSTMCHVLNIKANELKNLLEILQDDDYIYDLNFRKSCDTFFLYSKASCYSIHGTRRVSITTCL